MESGSPNPVTTLTNNIANSNTGYEGDGYGIYFDSSSNNTLTDNTANSNSFYGIYLWSSSNNTITDNTASSNSGSGILLAFSSNNTIYNNYFNNANNFRFTGTISINYWNTTKQAGTNIIGGSYLGGNFWAYPNGTGFSETCTDADYDGICDSSYSLASGNVDYLPLTTPSNFFEIPPETLQSINNTTNGSGFINLTDKNVSQAFINQTGVIGYEYLVTTNGTTPVVSISVNLSLEPPAEVSDIANETGAVPGFYYEIEVNDSSWYENVTEIQLRIYYSISNINLSSGVSESSLRPVRYTNNSWVRLDCDALGSCTYTLADGTKLYAAGAVTSSETATPYVWANLSNFSVYGIAGAVYGVSGVVIQPASGGGGGGGAAPTTKVTTSPGKVEITIPSIPAGIIKIVEIPDTENVYLTLLVINVSKKVSNAKLTVLTLESRPTETEELPKDAYRYNVIETKNIDDDNINNVIMGFKVEQSWMRDKNIAPDTVFMNRYHNDTWNKLSTIRTGNGSNSTYYSAVSPGFSYFAISGEKIVEVTVPPTITPMPTTPAPSTPAPTVPPVTTPAPMPPSLMPPAKTGIVLILIVAIAAGVYVFVRRKEV